MFSKLSLHFYLVYLQKDAWETAVSDLKLGIDNKLDRMELDPLKAYLDKRIKAVDAKVIKHDIELPEDAAGFRRYTLNNLKVLKETPTYLHYGVSLN